MKNIKDIMRKRVNKIYLLVIPILLMGVMLRKVNVPICLAAILPLLFTLNRHEVALVFSFVLPQLFGLIANVFHIGIPGSIIAMIIAILVLWNDFFKIFSRENLLSLWYIFVIYAICLLFWIYGDFSNYGTSKMTGMLFTITWSSISVFMMTSFKDIRYERFAPVFLLVAVTMLAIPWDFMGYVKPDGVFDFETYRLGLQINKMNDLPYVSYHMPAITALIGFSFYISSKKEIFDKWMILCFFVTLYIILVSGTRQALFGISILLCCWFIMRNNRFNFSGIVLSGLFIWLGFFLLQHLDIPAIQQIFDVNRDADSRLNRNWDWPLYQITQYPLLGVGLGNYLNPYTGEYYPHNIFLEILCEMGFVGLIIVAGIVINFIHTHSLDVYFRLHDNTLVFLIILPYFIRANISNDIIGNLEFFIIFFGMYSSQWKIMNEKSVNKPYLYKPS